MKNCAAPWNPPSCELWALAAQAACYASCSGWFPARWNSFHDWILAGKRCKWCRNPFETKLSLSFVMFFAAHSAAKMHLQSTLQWLPSNHQSLNLEGRWKVQMFSDGKSQVWWCLSFILRYFFLRWDSICFDVESCGFCHGLCWNVQNDDNATTMMITAAVVVAAAAALANWNPYMNLGCYPLVNCHITMERSTIFHGKIHYFYGHIQ